MRLRSRQDTGTIIWDPTPFGLSHKGIPLEVWLPSGDCKLLIHAGIHGEEGETTVALSRALRLLTEPSPNCAVVLAANPDGLVRGTRGNARGVDLNRNFPTKDWQPEAVTHRSTLDDPSDILLSTGIHPGSEMETAALMGLVDELKPEDAIALHAPLACIDTETPGPLSRWLAERTGLPLVQGVGYATPGSFGAWGTEQGIRVVTYEFPLVSNDVIVHEHVPILVELLSGNTSWS